MHVFLQGSEALSTCVRYCMTRELLAVRGVCALGFATTPRLASLLSCVQATLDGAKPGSTGGIFDVVRAMVVCSNMSSLAEVRCARVSTFLLPAACLPAY
jgi:hypothetical protein